MPKVHDKAPAVGARRSAQTRSTTSDFRAVLDTMLEGCQIIDFQWRYVYLNKVALAHSHKSKRSLIGHTMMECYPGIEKTKMFALVHECMEQRVNHCIENEFIYPGGEKGWFELRIEPVPQGVLIFSIDITRKKEIEHAKDDFVSLASHQLRTPPSVINWSAELLANDKTLALSPAQAKLVDQIFQTNRRMIQLIDAMLNISRLELETFAVEPEPARIADLANAVISDLAPLIAHKNLHMTTSYKPATIRVHTDKNLIQIILQNLLLNAIKYTPEHGTISLSVIKNDTSVEIKVADSGCGIPVHQRSHIFTKLFRADNAQAIDPAGTGLGLYLVKLLVEYMQGKIRFTSKENKGTTFYITLPLGGVQKRKGTTKLVRSIV